MTAADKDFIIEQAATFIQPIIWTTTNNVPIDITDYTAKMTIDFSDMITGAATSYTLDSTYDPPTIQIVGLEGKFTLYIPYQDTASFTILNGVYDLVVQAPDTIVTRLLEGKIVVDPAITII